MRPESLATLEPTGSVGFLRPARPVENSSCDLDIWIFKKEKEKKKSEA